MVISEIVFSHMFFFSTIFVAPGVRPSYSRRDTLWVCMEIFPLLGLELKLFGFHGGFSHSLGSTGSGHF